MATNTAVLKTFAQQTRAKLVSLVSTKMRYVLNEDTAELRGYERQIAELRNQIQSKTEKIVIEEIAYTWFNRVMALRFMDANGYNSPMIVTPAAGQTRPEILQDAMGGSIDNELMLSAEERLLPEAMLYRKLLVAVCNKKMPQPMPFLFEHISDYTELLLPDDLLSDQSFVTDIRNGMTDGDCQNVEIIGWLYQFYITDRKADAESKKSKKGGLKSDEQAAATQLFTPHWIVRYMVENSLGRIWMTLHPESSLIKEMPYYITTPEGQTDIIPEDIHSARDIRFLDPCVGSGHILVYAFDLFCKMYEEEGEQAKDIPALILENNLYGIDIDRRCYQLASFALTMKARAYYRRYLRRTVTPHVISLAAIDHDTIQSTGAWPSKSLMWQFENIDTIGSLLKVTPEECAAIHFEKGLFGIRQQVMKTQAEYLSRQYHCVVTNPPYLGKGFCDALKNYVAKEYPNSKSDTMAIFMERCLELCKKSGRVSIINMHSWMFIASFEKLRKTLLKKYYIETLLHLGAHAFDEIGGEVVQSVSFTLAKHLPLSGIYYRLLEGENSSEKEQLFLARKNCYKGVLQKSFELIPGCPIGYWASKALLSDFKNSFVGDKSVVKIGMGTGKNDIFLKKWWEVKRWDINTTLTNISQLANSSSKFFPYNKGGEYRLWYGNIVDVVWFDENGRNYMNSMSGHRENGGYDCYFNEGITWSFIGTGRLGIRYLPSGCLFDVAGSSLFSKNCNLKYILGLLSTNVSYAILKILNPTINFQAGNIKSIPLIIDKEEEVVEKVQNNISISRYDWDSHETSWDFKRNPLWEQQLEIFVDKVANSMPDLTVDDIEDYYVSDLLLPLSVLVTNYESRWENLFYKLHSNEEELNRIFIEIYGLQDELSPEVPLNEVTILQKGEISIEDNKVIWHEDVIIKQLISYLIGCLMGRYAIDKPGLIIASQGQKIENLDLPTQTIEIDDDGIIPIIQEEDFFVDDMTQRIEVAVKTLFGEMNFYENMKYIKSCLGQDLRDYLFKNYYADHQQMYSVKGAKRPIYWLFSSQMGDKKKKGYFKALVYMHRLEADTLSKLHADYVHPYIQKIEQQLREAEDNATRDDLNQTQYNKALKLAEELRDKVREVKAFETVLVEMASARITIDLDDGVKANYPKFYPLVEPIKGLEKSNED